ncbi:snare protein syntaxin 18/UFE1 [Desarmillaria tabescens]|uniref:Snare protein syntaxin 18/UFE1 n=1 Tax=Armillaria tabescens TaxID=1929756 RepID=A0AA39U0Q7_ARMTA|nr:snare protein syntaxin 18/UFE1 [Desarmillaria tabescens]KAK0468314.1 snare protein syntaxin 18/UFE1 [Desarmillaria tabescens]
MAYTDRTSDFKETVRKCRASLPNTDRRKSASDRQSREQDLFGKEYVSEAYKILTHITTLTRMLSTIRKPYLNLDSRRGPFARHTSRTLDFSGNDEQSWSSIRQLSNEERDQIDLQARLILSRCADRVKEIEALEKRRAELVASKTNPLTRFLPARLRQDESSIASDFIAAHHSSITWYLNRRLAEASQSQKIMQEERVKRELERSRTLGSGAAKAALDIGNSDLRRGKLARAGRLPGPLQPRSDTTPSSVDSALSMEDDDDDIELSASQILQFETENANILRGVQDTLESVQQAESRLMDISALQMEADQLYEDAIATTGMVEKGNVQLREARRRAKDGRIFILLFLIGASLSLLFLHYY